VQRSERANPESPDGEGGPARARPLNPLVPVMLTSSQEESDLVRAYDLGANSYLVKPLESEAFMKAVAELGLYWMLLNKVPGETR
jgi:two-component system response regulator